MPRATTTFDTALHHIHTEILVTHSATGTTHEFEAVLDTGAPWTEISDVVLPKIGLADVVKDSVQIKSGLQTQKYAKVVLPRIETCGQVVENLPVVHL